MKTHTFWFYREQRGCAGQANVCENAHAFVLPQAERICREGERVWACENTYILVLPPVERTCRAGERV